MRRRQTPVRHRDGAPPPGDRPARHRSPAPAVRAAVRGGRAEVQLSWARDRDGAKLHVGRIDPKDRHARAPFSCLGCGEPLVPHLGKVRARHFAHEPGSRCPLTAPETALHLDVKERLLALAAEAFAGARRVTVLSRCPGCRRLAPRDLADEGDRAEAEGAVGTLRADVLVSRKGTPALALEVRVTHAVDPEKEAALARAGVPAVEIDAHAEWEERDGDAVRIACARSLGFPPCPACAATARADVERSRGGEAAEIAELEAYRARGLFGRPAVIPAGGGVDDPLDGAAPGGLRARFRCPDCGSAELRYGERLARHACAGGGERTVAWRGYDGQVVELSWWRRPGTVSPGGGTS